MYDMDIDDIESCFSYIIVLLVVFLLGVITAVMSQDTYYNKQLCKHMYPNTTQQYLEHIQKPFSYNFQETMLVLDKVNVARQ